MAPWWTIRYLDRGTKKAIYDSELLPFKLLPELERVNLKKGHKFKTDQFEIEIPGADIKLYMYQSTLWVKNKPYIVKGATRVILFTRNHNRNDGHKWKEVCIGLMTETGYGVLVKYNMVSGKYNVKLIEGNIPDPKVVLQDQPKLPSLRD